MLRLLLLLLQDACMRVVASWYSVQRFNTTMLLQCSSEVEHLGLAAEAASDDEEKLPSCIACCALHTDRCACCCLSCGCWTDATVSLRRAAARTLEATLALLPYSSRCSSSV